MKQTKRLYKTYLEEDFKHLSAQLSYEAIMIKLFCIRGLDSENKIQHFLTSSFESLYSPFLMKGMETAVQRILEAIKLQQEIVIYGDYDVDGITSTANLFLFLTEIGAKVSYYIPDRIKEGYGLNTEALGLIKAKGAGLVITVDTGIAAVEAAQFAKEIDLDLMITDHHECQSVIPNALVVLNPKQEDCLYPFDMLAGVGVVFKLMQGLAIKLHCEEQLHKYLDLVAVGTIADIAPIRDENRLMTKLAFEQIFDTNSMGLKALFKVSDIVGPKMSAGMIGFRIGPRLNAAGRMGDAKKGVQLFVSRDLEEVESIAQFLNEENKKRQDMEMQILEEAIAIVESDKQYLEEDMLVIASEKWHHGVIGIVASRLVERYYKPVILLTVEAGIASGSARSVADFNLFKALVSVEDLFIKYGGHEMAAGMSLLAEQIVTLRERMNTYAQVNLTQDMKIPKVRVDLSLTQDEISIELIEKLSLFEPYGVGNEEPQFEFVGYPKYIKRIGQNQKHLKFQLREGDMLLDCIGFSLGERADFLSEGQLVSVVGTLNINEWQQKKSMQLMIKDIQWEESTTHLLETMFDYIDQLRRLGYAQLKDSGFDYPTRVHYEELYRLLYSLSKKLESSMTYTKLLELLGLKHMKELFPYFCCLLVFEELELYAYDLERHSLVFVLKERKKVELESSKMYNILAMAKSQ